MTPKPHRTQNGNWFLYSVSFWWKHKDGEENIHAFLPHHAAQWLEDNNKIEEMMRYFEVKEA